MSIWKTMKKTVINWLLEDDEKVIELNENMEYVAPEHMNCMCDVTPIKDKIIEENTQKAAPAPPTKRGGGSKKETKKKIKRYRRKQVKLTPTDSIDTTGIVKVDRKGKYFFEYKTKQMKFPFNSNGDKEKIMELYKQFNQSDKSQKSFEKLRKQLRKPRKLTEYPQNIWYESSNNGFKIRANGVNFGIFDTLERASYVNDYLKFKHYDSCFSPKELCNKRHVPREEYYQTMKFEISKDREYMKFNKEGIYATEVDKNGA